jgi:hypothetical protein
LSLCGASKDVVEPACPDPPPLPPEPVGAPPPPPEPPALIEPPSPLLPPVPDSPPFPCAPPTPNAPPEPLFPPEAARPPAPVVPPVSVRPPECPPTWLLPPLPPAVLDAGLLQAPAGASARAEIAPQRRNCPTHGEQVFIGDTLTASASISREKQASRGILFASMRQGRGCAAWT